MSVASRPNADADDAHRAPGQWRREMPGAVEPDLRDSMKILRIELPGIGRDDPRRNAGGPRHGDHQMGKVAAHALAGDEAIRRVVLASLVPAT